MVYNMMYNSHERLPNWAASIKQLLFKYDFVTEWERQEVQNEIEFIKNLREKMIHDFDIEWVRTMEASNRYSLYRQLKSARNIESYLYAI